MFQKKHVLSTLTASMMFMVAATETPLSATPCADQNKFSLAYFGFISLNVNLTSIKDKVAILLVKLPNPLAFGASEAKNVTRFLPAGCFLLLCFTCWNYFHLLDEAEHHLLAGGLQLLDQVHQKGSRTLCPPGYNFFLCTPGYSAVYPQNLCCPQSQSP